MHSNTIAARTHIGRAKGGVRHGRSRSGMSTLYVRVAHTPPNSYTYIIYLIIIIAIHSITVIIVIITSDIKFQIYR